MKLWPIDRTDTIYAFVGLLTLIAWAYTVLTIGGFHIPLIN